MNVYDVIYNLEECDDLIFFHRVSKLSSLKFLTRVEEFGGIGKEVMDAPYFF